jgi:uncharacterized membrane protein
MKDKSLLRHILKTISYRLIGSIFTFTIGYLATGDFKIGATMSFIELIIKPLIYFLHERFWFKFIRL